MNADQCFAQLKALASSKQGDVTDLAEAVVTEFIGDGSQDALGAATRLGQVQARLIKGATASPNCSDILDAMSASIERLLVDGPTRAA